MLGVARVHASGGEKKIPADIVTLRQERGPVIASGKLLGFLEVIERAGNVVQNPQRRRKADPRRAFGSGAQTEGERLLKRRRRFPGAPQLQANPRFQKRKLGAIRACGAKTESCLREIESLRGAVSPEPVLGRPPICSRRLRRPRLLQVHGVQEHVAFREPFRRPSVQRLPRVAEQRSVGGLADQRVPERDLPPARAQHPRARKPGEVDFLTAENVSERVGFEIVRRAPKRPESLPGLWPRGGRCEPG